MCFKAISSKLKKVIKRVHRKSRKRRKSKDNSNVKEKNIKLEEFWHRWITKCFRKKCVKRIKGCKRFLLLF